MNNALDRLPLSLDEVTPEWLTSVLQVRYPGVEITGVTRDREFFGTAASARMHLSYVDPSAARAVGAPASVHVKGGFDDKWRKRVWVALQQEVRFYQDFAPDITLNIADAYYAGLDDSPQGILVLEDLVNRGVRFGQNLAPVTADDVANVLEQVATMHAQWWGSPRLKAISDWGVPQRTFLKYVFRPKHWDELVAYKHGELLVQAVGTADRAIKALERLWEINDSQPQTLVHGDLHGGNIFYESDGRPGFLDWQLAFPSTYAHDMAWIIVTALEVDQRREYERDLIKTYLAALKASHGDAPSFDEAWLAHRRNMAHAIASYGAVPRDNGPEEVIQGAAWRAFNGAIDHDALKALDL